MLESSWRKKLFFHIKARGIEKGYFIDVVNGVSDHVHCLVSLKPTHTVSKLVKDLKGESSRWINSEEFTPYHFEWARGYAAIAVSPSDVRKIRTYILRQEEHHQDFSSEVEWEELLASFRDHLVAAELIPQLLRLQHSRNIQLPGLQ